MRPSKQINDSDGIRYAQTWLKAMAELGLQSGPVVVSIGRPRRTIDQNALLWALLTDISRQVDWYGQKLTPENWKDVLTSALRKQKVVPGIDGGFVVCGTSTRKMDKSQFSELIELIYAFGAEHDVVFSGDKKPRAPGEDGAGE